MENWESVFKTGQNVRAEIARSVLEENGINAVIINKQDSNYPVFGFSEVFVPINEAALALTILTNESALKESE
jgi:hypothetical protein